MLHFSTLVRLVRLLLIVVIHAFGEVASDIVPFRDRVHFRQMPPQIAHCQRFATFGRVILVFHHVDRRFAHKWKQVPLSISTELARGHFWVPSVDSIIVDIISSSAIEVESTILTLTGVIITNAFRRC